MRTEDRRKQTVTIGMATFEDAVRWYRSLPNNNEAVLANYFDLPVQAAAERFAGGSEFAEIARILGKPRGGAVLELGAGHGIASLALARRGWKVTALEPDPSDEVGAGAIRRLTNTGRPIEVVQGWGESLPFADKSFAAVFGRQVLHHAADLDAMMREAARVTKPGGRLLFVREHVVDDEKQLASFLQSHPLHHIHGSENAYALARYFQAFRSAGLQVARIWGPIDSVLNFYPGREQERRTLHRKLRIARFLAKILHRRPDLARRWVVRSRVYESTPGRLYSFLLRAPS